MKAKELIEFEADDFGFRPSVPTASKAEVVIEGDFWTVAVGRRLTEQAASCTLNRPQIEASTGLRPELACFFALAKKPGHTYQRPQYAGVLAELSEGFGRE